MAVEAREVPAPCFGETRRLPRRLFSLTGGHPALHSTAGPAAVHGDRTRVRGCASSRYTALIGVERAC